MRRTAQIALVLLLAALISWPLAAARRGPAEPAPRATEPGGALAVHARTEVGWAFAAELRPEGGALLPLVSRSERVVRLARGRDGTAVLLVAPDGAPLHVERVHARVLDHAADQQVLFLDGAAALVGPPTLPSRATAQAPGAGEARDALPWLARQDGNALDPARVVLEAPEERTGLDWILIGAELPEGAGAGRLELRDAPARELPARHRAALRLTGSARVEGTLVGAALDQAFLARVERPADSAWRPLAPGGARLHALEGLEARPWREQGPARPEVRLGDARAERPDPAALAEGGPGIGLPAGAALELLFPDPALEGVEGTQTLLLEVRWRAMGAAPATAPARLDAPRASAPLLVDRAALAGVVDVHFEGPDEQLDIRPTMGPGAAFGDFDGDGWVDLYLVQGAGREGSAPPRNRLLKNLGEGTFADVSRASGTDHAGAGMAALFLDVDGDGDLDLFVANYGPDVLYENRGDGTFVDVSEAWGVGGDLWSAGVAAADFDGDGDLDLYVTSYLDFDLAKMPPAEELAGLRREDPVEMLPFAFPGQRNVFLRNRSADAVDPAFTFEDATAELGLLDEQGRGMQPVFWDFDLDGDLDLYVANDVSPNVLWRNEGDGTFRDVSFQTGMDDPRGGMGVALGDVDGDGDEDLFLTNWELEANALYLNNLVVHREGRHRVATFRDGVVRAGLGPPSVGVTGWGCVFFDLDLDGHLDLFVANGYTSPDYQGTGICVGQPDHLFRGDGTGRFEDLSRIAGPDVRVPLASRAALACDYDQDGALDLLVTANNGRLRLLASQAPRRGDWLGVRLRGRGANTHAIGARVTVRAGGREFLQVLAAGTGYLGGNAPELHFGLGPTEGEAQIEVRWPSGATTRHTGPVGRFVTLREE